MNPGRRGNAAHVAGRPARCISTEAGHGKAGSVSVDPVNPALV
jgi:hypothetical protein